MFDVSRMLRAEVVVVTGNKRDAWQSIRMCCGTSGVRNEIGLYALSAGPTRQTLAPTMLVLRTGSAHTLLGAQELCNNAVRYLIEFK
jgi:hypothetical protein